MPKRQYASRRPDYNKSPECMRHIKTPEEFRNAKLRNSPLPTYYTYDTPESKYQKPESVMVETAMSMATAYLASEAYKEASADPLMGSSDALRNISDWGSDSASDFGGGNSDGGGSEI